MANELYHFNQNHDPRTGKFTFGKGGPKNYIGSGGSGRNGKITNHDIEKAKAQRKKERKRFRNMTDEELQNSIKRLELEKKYRELTDADINVGKQYATELLKTAGQSAVKTVTPQLITVGVDLYRKKKGIFKSK